VLTAFQGRSGSLRARLVTVLILARGGMCAPACAQKLVFAHYMVTNQAECGCGGSQHCIQLRE
jgi:hypothetical protein